jgi:hypothetical protein
MFKTKAISIFFIFIFLSKVNSQECDRSVAESTSIARFVDLNNGTISDTKTGLVWMKCSLGQIWSGARCEGNALNISWSDALIEAAEYEFLELTDWRLPNIKESASIIENSCENPALNIDVFPTEAYRSYWTSTPDINSPGYIFFIWLQTGDIMNVGIHGSLQVRLVH